jgi:hypothetical protein
MSRSVRGALLSTLLLLPLVFLGNKLILVSTPGSTHVILTDTKLPCTGLLNNNIHCLPGGVVSPFLPSPFLPSAPILIGTPGF